MDNLKDIYELYIKQLDEIQAAMNVYKKGIQDELKELSMVEVIQTQLRDAVEFAHSTAPIVSIQEYARLKNDIKTIEEHISEKRKAIKKIENILNSRHKEVSDIGRKIEELQKNLNGADILNFHGKEKK